MQILPNGRVQFIDSSGAPLASGNVGFYAPGTLNPLTTYQDQAGTIPNANPVPLDSRGQALIWGSGIFRQILKDASGVTIWDALTQSSDASFSGSGGAALIGFDGTNLAVQLQTRVNRVVDSIAALRALSKATYTRAWVTGYYAPHDGGGGAYQYDSADTTTADNNGTVIVAADGGRWKLQLTTTVSVKQFGAKGDGTTDDTAAINKALAGAGVGQIYFPSGTYNTIGAHSLVAGQYLIGQGKGTTTIFNTSTTSDTFDIPASFCGISDMALSGTAARTTGTHINATAPSHTYIRRVTIFNFHVGIAISGVVQYIEDCDISLAATTTGAGILITGGNDQFIRGVIMDCATGPKSLAGLQVSNCFAAWVSDCDFIHCQNGVLLAPGPGQTVEFMFFHNVACDTSTNNGWNITTSGTGVIYECGFSQCWAASCVNSGILMLASTGSINGLSFSNTRSLNNGGDGIFLQGSVSNVNVTGGLVSGNSQTVAATQYGIHVGANVSDVQISGVRVGPTGQFADTQLAQVQVDTGSGNRISVVGCNLNTARTAITMLATGANNVIESNTGFVSEGFVSATTDGSGHIVVTHGSGAIPKSMMVTVSNAGAALFMQTDSPNTSNFRVTVFSSSGAVAASTAVSFSWRIGF